MIFNLGIEIDSVDYFGVAIIITMYYWLRYRRFKNKKVIKPNKTVEEVIV